MEKCRRRCWAATVVICLAATAPAAAAVVKTSFNVSATVVATCRIVPGQAKPCAPVGSRASAIGAGTPVVTYNRDAKTGAVIQTIEF